MNDVSKLKYLFGENYHEWSYEKDYLRLVSPDQVIKFVLNEADNHYNMADFHIWDMFGGIGTDAIRLASGCRKVTCSEIDGTTYDHLKKNIEQQDVNNVTPIFSDCVAMLKTLPDDVDLIYFDPPWGTSFESGKKFSFENITLPNGTNIMDLVKKCAATKKHLIIKSPENCLSFELAFDEQIKRILSFPKPKLKFIFI